MPVRVEAIEIELTAPAEVVEAISLALPELESQLAEKWAIDEVRLLYKNPYLFPHHPDFYVQIVLAAAKEVSKVAGTLLVRDAYDWLKKRYKQVKKVKPPVRTKRAK